MLHLGDNLPRCNIQITGAAISGGKMCRSVVGMNSVNSFVALQRCTSTKIRFSADIKERVWYEARQKSQCYFQKGKNVHSS